MNALASSTESHPLRVFYRALFSEVTRRDWFHDVYEPEPMVDALLQILAHAELPVQDLKERRSSLLRWAEVPMVLDYFDLIRTLRSWFSGIHGGLGSLIARAAIAAMAREWPLNLNPETLKIAKGMALHLAEGVAPRDSSEYELACLMLRPQLDPGAAVLHASSGRYGEVVAAAVDGVAWTPFSPPNAPAELARDVFDILSLEPLVRGLPMRAADPFPRVTVDDIWAEYRSFMTA